MVYETKNNPSYAMVTPLCGVTDRKTWHIDE
jgi:hypothetical protein